MPNTNPQAVLISNDKMRKAADRAAQLYLLFKSLQIEYNAENWNALFPADAELIVDGSAIDGRTPITNNDVRGMFTFIDAYITFMEQNTNLNRNLVNKIAVNPERI